MNINNNNRLVNQPRRQNATNLAQVLGPNVIVDTADPNNPDGGGAPAIAPNQNQFGAVRDRLFHAMLVKVTLGYCQVVNTTGRRLVEFFALLSAVFLLFVLLFIHLMMSKATSDCLDNLRSQWPRDGILRVEVVENMDVLENKEKFVDWYVREKSKLQCYFDPKLILMQGPQAIPAEIRQGYQTFNQTVYVAENQSLLRYFLNFPVEFFSSDQQYKMEVTDDPLYTDAERSFDMSFLKKSSRNKLPNVVLRVEYSLFYGLLRLPISYRDRQKIDFVRVRLDADDACFGDNFTRAALKTMVGYEETIISSLRSMVSSNDSKESLTGYLHNLDTDDHFHFVSHGMTKLSYISAALVMLIFTFTISLLLRFSHHQIFVFIVDLLHMFEHNQPLSFPAAPLLTVILALVGMEAIMSEVFGNTSTAFYVIIIVWIADQFDAICCHSPISKRFWLRFFYLYQFFFYSYQYRFGGTYGGYALCTSMAFIIHSMIYFFHHYEMPLILYQERVQRMLSEVQAAPPMMPESDEATIPQMQEEGGAALPVDMANVVNPSSVFDARSPPARRLHEASSSVPTTAPPPPPSPPSEASNAEERVAEEVVNDAIDELFQS